MAWPTWRRRRLASLLCSWAALRGTGSGRGRFIGRRAAGRGGHSTTPGGRGRRKLAFREVRMSSTQDPAEIAAQLAELRLEHRDLDQAIERLSTDRSVDELALKRLKKRKLRLKDMIATLESRLIPDLDA